MIAPSFRRAASVTPRRVIATFLLIFACVTAEAWEHDPVPDKAAAIALAEKRLIPIYGKKQIESERSFKAELNGNVWHVWGYLPPDSASGVAEIWIDKINGKTLNIRHAN
jgi:NTF2 fold immunity protein